MLKTGQKWMFMKSKTFEFIIRSIRLPSTPPRIIPRPIVSFLLFFCKYIMPVMTKRLIRMNIILMVFMFENNPNRLPLLKIGLMSIQCPVVIKFVFLMISFVKKSLININRLIDANIKVSLFIFSFSFTILSSCFVL